ncbi:MAG TPA: TIR domain-containing protein [Vicinamibacterales bacterium]|nr:TIR domain-containing protein [Vicinamibacterales bacterium]
MADIFISYAREDRARVRSLAAALSAHGWSVWWDRQIQAGKMFDQVITDALASARCVVVVWSHQSIASNWVREEAEDGRRRGILIPVLIDEARPPLGFGRIQAVELGDWTGAESSDAFQKLVADVTAILGPPHLQGTVTGSPSIEPQAGAPASVTSSSAGRLDEASSSIVGERRGKVAADALLVGRSKSDDAEAPAGRTRDAPRTPGNFDLSDNRVRWSLAAAFALAILAVGLYRLGTGGNGTSQPRPTTEPSTGSALQLNAVTTEGGKPLRSGVRYEVSEMVKDADGNRKRVTDSDTHDGPPRFPLPPGRYHVTATYGSASAGTDVEVEAAKITRQTLILRAGILSLTTVLAAGGTPLQREVRYEVDEPVKDADGNRKRVAFSDTHEGPPRFPLAAGRYYVTAAYQSASAASEVEVAAGDEPTRQLLDLRAGILSLTTVLAAGGTPLQRGVRYEVDDSAKDADGNRKRVAFSDTYEGPPRFPLPAGRYYVTATYQSASAASEVEVAAGDEPTRQILDLRAGILSLTTVPAAGGTPLQRGVRYEVDEPVKDADGNRKRVVFSDTHEGPPRFPLPAGRYYVTASSDEGKGGSEVTISPGEVRQVQLRLSRKNGRN